MADKLKNLLKKVSVKNSMKWRKMWQFKPKVFEYQILPITFCLLLWMYESWHYKDYNIIYIFVFVVLAVVDKIK